MKILQHNCKNEKAIIVHVSALDGDCFGITLSSGHTILLELGRRIQEPAFEALIENGLFDKPQTDGERLFWQGGPSFLLSDIYAMVAQSGISPQRNAKGKKAVLTASKNENMTNKKILVVTAAVAGVLILAFIAVIVTGLLKISGKDDLLTAEQLKLYEELSNNYAHYTKEALVSIPIDELEYSATDGIDYSSGDITAAFTDLYGSVHAKEISNNNAVYSERKNAPKASKQVDKANSSAPTPALYKGGVDIRQDGKGDLIDINDLDDYDRWLGMGDLISDYIEEWSDPGDMSDPGDGYGEWYDSEFWELFADYIIEKIKNELLNSGYLIDSETLGALISEALIEYAGDQWIDSIYWGGLGDIVDDYVNEEWSDPGDMSDPGDTGDDIAYEYNPGYDMSVISYKTTGRQFYREALSSRQQKAYDVLATAIQRGNFSINYYDFGITSDEADAVINAVVWDNPEFMFIRGHSYGPVDTENITTIEILLDDDIMQIGIDKALSDITTRSAPVIAAANQLNSDIDKVKYIVDYLCKVNVYSENPQSCKYGQGIYSAIVTNEVICSGYASAFHYYMNALGIGCTRLSSCDHLWNLLFLGGDFYYMDVTWIDTPHWELINGTQTLVDTTYDWFNFNEGIAAKFKAKTKSNAHNRDFLAVLLPAANGSKYSYANWYKEDAANLSDDVSDVSEDWNDPGDKYNDWNDPGHSEYIESSEDYSSWNEPDVSIEDEPTVIIEGVDVSDELLVIEIENEFYAQGESFVESLRTDNMPAGMHSYNFNFLTNYDEIYEYISEFDYDIGTFVRDDYEQFLSMDAIIINSWFTDSVMYILFVDSTTLICYDEYYYSTLMELSEAPRIVDGEVYLPMEAFADLTGYEIIID